MNRRDASRGLAVAIVGALLAMPYAAIRYEHANALSCCENPPAGAIWAGLIVVPAAVLASWPLMGRFSGRLHAMSPIARLALLAVVGTALGALVGWCLFKLTLLNTEAGHDLSTWGVGPGALVGVEAALGWWVGTEILGRKKVKNG